MMNRSELEKYTNREQFGLLYKSLGCNTGAEIGVYVGDYANSMLSQYEDLFLHLVDDWKWDHDNPPDTVETFEKVQSLLAPYANRTAFHKMTSVEAASYIPDESLDFVYIDADHSYESAKQDIEAWFPKVKQGGIVAGHDINVWCAFEQVLKAVYEFALKHPQYSICVTTKDEANSWFFYKGETKIHLPKTKVIQLMHGSSCEMIERMLRINFLYCLHRGYDYEIVKEEMTIERLKEYNDYESIVFLDNLSYFNDLDKSIDVIDKVVFGEQIGFVNKMDNADVTLLDRFLADSQRHDFRLYSEKMGYDPPYPASNPQTINTIFEIHHD